MSRRLRTWFTADTHLGHARIIELCNRPFGSVAEMNETIIDKWNDVVDDADLVWILGDYALGPIAESLPLVGRLNGKKYLLCGNHDRPFHGYGDHARKPEKLQAWRQRYLDAGFTAVITGEATRKTGAVITIPLRDALGAHAATVGLCHFPVTGESAPGEPDRFVDYRPRRVPARDLPAGVPAAQPTYDWLVHGHVHTAWTVNGTQLNVGVDVWDFAPVPEDMVISIVREGMPECACQGVAHPSGSPGCAINGGPGR